MIDVSDRSANAFDFIILIFPCALKGISDWADKPSGLEPFSTISYPERPLFTHYAIIDSYQEADAVLDMERRAFYSASMDYVLMLQKVQEKKKFEFVETLLRFMYAWLTFYHQVRHHSWIKVILASIFGHPLPLFTQWTLTIFYRCRATKSLRISSPTCLIFSIVSNWQEIISTSTSSRPKNWGTRCSRWWFTQEVERAWVMVVVRCELSKN